MTLYAFSCFKIPDQVCRKLDSIMNAFWWGHDIGARKLHMIGWDILCLPKQEGGFLLMNKAMLTNQFWRIASNPDLLLSKAMQAFH
jgi:hypothetical protein